MASLGEISFPANSQSEDVSGACEDPGVLSPGRESASLCSEPEIDYVAKGYLKYII